ncbi:MAG TPA: NACHT domain-containing protein [Puia sp.]|nr:NACHT domain-containing protein [Puia sp.]
MDKEQILLEFQKITEKNLIKNIILPLLEKMGYETIEYRHGVYEKGIDILCVREDELGDPDVLAIQVKKFAFSGNFKSEGNIYGIINQLDACKTETIQMKNGQTLQATRVWFISPYRINLAALTAAFKKLNEARLQHVKIVDGDKLYELIFKKAPEVLLKLGDKRVIYNERFKSEIPILQEAASFKLKDKSPLSRQYIKMYLSLLPANLTCLYFQDFFLLKKREIKNETYSIQSIVEFNELCRKVLDIVPIRMDKADDNDKKIILTLNGEKLINRMLNNIQKEITLIKDSENKPTDKAGSSLKEYKSTITQYARIADHDAFGYLLELSYDPEKRVSFDITIESILESGLNFQVTGEAGGGKTTLLRMIGLMAIRSSRLPIFIPLADLGEKQTLVKLIRHSANNYGLNITEENLVERLEKGEALLLFDGIDEAIARVEHIKKDLLALADKYPRTQLIITTRPWSAFRHHDSFLAIGLLPFSVEQVDAFFRNWFQDEPQKGKEIIDHLKSNKDLYKIVSTPLVATIFAALKTHGGQLPKDLVDVYAQRLSLLLNDWDDIKGVVRDNFDPKDKFFFLRKLAFRLHNSNSRFLSWEELISDIFSNIGIARSEETAVAFANELIKNNNVIFKDASNEWGLGHLQYQEYLAAVELKENRQLRKYRLLGNGWWAKVLENYAWLTRDISDILEDAISSKSLDMHFEQLTRLVKFAPNTDKKLKTKLLAHKSIADLKSRHREDFEDSSAELDRADNLDKEDWPFMDEPDRW